MGFRAIFTLQALAALSLLGCAPFRPEGPVEIAIIDDPANLFDEGPQLSPAAQYLRAASREGLVALDPSGQVIPALAERWIITDDGLSYIFRLRERDWPDDEPINASDVRAILRDLIEELRDTPLGLDLAKVTEVRAMTSRVIELRLSSPMPEFLRLLAQPELGLIMRGSGAGPMIASRGEEEALVRLSALPPRERGMPDREDWEASNRTLAVRAMPARAAIADFAQGDADLLLGGDLISFPYIDLGPLSRGAIQLDPAQGLLGLAFMNESGLLADQDRREALSMAIDRSGLIQPFGLGGWQPATWIVPPALIEVPGEQLAANRWEELTLEERRGIARNRIAQWQADNPGEEAVVRIGLPPGPGSELLFRGLAESWAGIGVRALRIAPGEGADLEWRDRIARYSSPRWYLNQFNCAVELGLCSQSADEVVKASLSVTDAQQKRQLLAQANALLIAEEVFIPLGAPVRWSLVRSSISNYQPNPWAIHPLFPISGPTT